MSHREYDNMVYSCATGMKDKRPFLTCVVSTHVCLCRPLLPSPSGRGTLYAGYCLLLNPRTKRRCAHSRYVDTIGTGTLQVTLVRVGFYSTEVITDTRKRRASLLLFPTNRKHEKSTRVDYNTIVT